MKEEPDIKISGIGCLTIAIIIVSAMFLFAYKERTDALINKECWNKGGKMVQTNKWYENYQMNCIVGER